MLDCDGQYSLVNERFSSDSRKWLALWDGRVRYSQEEKDSFGVEEYTEGKWVETELEELETAHTQPGGSGEGA